MKIQSIGIIGGTHGIGAAFAAYFSKSGEERSGGAGEREVMVSGRNTKITNKEIVQSCDLVIFAVPISATQAVMDEMIEFSRKDQIWADFTSVKTPFVEKMCKSCAQVIGMHPLFGPMRDIRGHKIFVCPERITDESFESVKALFSEFELIEKTSEEHDLLMGVVQNVSHFSDFVMGETLRRIGMDMEEIIQYSTPSYQLKLEVMGRMFDQSSDLYASIATQNPKGDAFSRIFAEVSEEFHQFVREQKAEELRSSFEGITDYLGAEFCKDAHQHSQRFMHLYAPEVITKSEGPFDVAIFGDRYSHTDEASGVFLKKIQDATSNKEQSPSVGYFFNIFEVFEAVKESRVEYGIVPYENSTQGSVFDTLDGLFNHDQVKIVDLIERDISQHLLGLPGAKLSEIHKIYSHPQALAQSKDWIVKNLQDVELINASSTTQAAQSILQESNPYLGAIGSQMLGSGLGLEILQKDMQESGNRTKFLLIKRIDIKELKGDQGVSFSVWFKKDQAGSLAAVLNFLAEHQINLTKLDSRRASESKYGGYWFFMDAEIGIEDFRSYLPKLKKIVGGVKVLGSW